MIRKKISVRDLHRTIGPTTNILGSMERHVLKPCPIKQADMESVAFCSRKTKDALKTIEKSRAGIIICFCDLSFREKHYRNKTLLLVQNPRLAFIRVMREHFTSNIAFQISPASVIDAEAQLHRKVYIGPHSYIGKCRIAEGSIIHGNVHIYSNVKVGKRVTIHAGTVIGGDGFSYERNEEGQLEMFPHLGGVVIGDDVEIGANTCIDRGTMGNTTIGKGTKIDNLCHIAHNVVIGKHCLIIAQSMIGGSTRIGDYSWVAPCACLRDGIEVGDNALVGMGSVVTRSVAAGSVVLGVPAKEVTKPVQGSSPPSDSPT